MKSGLKNFYFTGIATFCFLLLFICGMSAKAAYIEGPEEDGYPTIVCDDGFEYQIKADEAVVRGYRGKSSMPTIPASVICNVDPEKGETDYPVGAIGKRAFSPYNGRKCIKIPTDRNEFSNVNGVFAGKDDNYKIEGIYITSDSIDTIGEAAFDGNSNIVSVVISPKVAVFGSYCFRDCVKLSSINIPAAVEEIPTSCFEGCVSLTKPPLNSGVTTIGDRAYKECTGISGTVSLHNGVVSVGAFAFEGCTFIKFEKIVLPNSITSIGKGAFEGCSNVKSINIPTGISVIPPRMCFGCHKLEGVAIPNNVKSIGDEAFAYCWGIKTVSLEENLEKIGKEAFYDTPEMGSITIPFSVTSISTKAIGYYLSEAGPRLVPKFKIYHYKNTAAEKYAIENNIDHEGVDKLGAVLISNKVEYVTTGNSEVQLSKVDSAYSTSFEVPKTIKVNGITYKVTGIADKAFVGCKKLKKVTILENVKTIGNSAFEGCSALTEVTIGKNVTSIGKKAFYKCKKLQTVTINSKKIKTFGKKCFKSIAKKANIKVPKAKLSNYKKKIKKSGIAKSVSVVKK